MLAEMSYSAFDNKLSIRFSREQHEWGGMDNNASLVLNSQARPFTALEVEFNPNQYFSYSTLTGTLEYFRYDSTKNDSAAFQNAFSIQQVEFNAKNYFHADFGTSVIWPKRFELGYMLPVYSYYLFQNENGDLDNLGVYASVKGEYPGVFSVWASGYLDEAELASLSTLFNKDRMMFALQAGTKINIPGLPFSSLTFTATKIEPYCYTHTRTYSPFLSYDSDGNQILARTTYMNNGQNLGYYIPPNSLELKARFDTMPFSGLKAHLQYQLIAHGADFGPHQVDGSNILSELSSGGRSTNKALDKDFLHDGAYEWMNIIKVGADWKLPVKVPVTLSAETGLVFSSFTDISDSKYNSFYGLTGTNEVSSSGYNGYEKSLRFVLTLGVKVFM
jgi:hypothetical protein